MLLSIPHPEDYGVSLRFGFLPDELPLERLTDPYYEQWENVIKNLQALILSRRIRPFVHKLPILSTDRLRSEPEWRRAYTVLAFISHAYIWGGDIPEEVVPPSISVPFLQTCTHLELPPVATYAATVLWNYKPLFPDEPIDSLENLSTLQTFTGSLDESWFYLVSTAIEARGAHVIPIMLRAMHAVRDNDRLTVIACLQSMAELLDELAVLLVRMYDSCDPHIFYHRIRPFLAGSKNMADAGLPNGVIFDDGSGSSKYVQHAGGSNAQSSLIHFFDLVLGVDHLPTGSRPSPDPSASSSATATALAAQDVPHGPAPPSHNFITEMRRYMPGPHRRFLEHVAGAANIRPFVTANRTDKPLTTAFDACLAMLRNLRDKHIQMVSRYIVVKSRESRSAGDRRSISPPLSSTTAHKRINLASRLSSSTTTPAVDETRKLRGTGGTALISFLKQARDETGDPSIGGWARRLLGNGPAAPLGGVDEHANGAVEIVGLAGIWSVDDSEGGICHW